MTTPDESERDAAAEDAVAEQKRERARLKKVAGSLGWKLIGSSTVEVKIEREFHFGPRTVIVRGARADSASRGDDGRRGRARGGGRRGSVDR